MFDILPEKNVHHEQGYTEARVNLIQEYFSGHLIFGILLCTVLFFMNATVFAEDGNNCSEIAKERIEIALKKLSIAPAEILSVKKTPIGGICEIAVKGQGGIRVFYTDLQLDYFLFGSLVETKSMANLTAQTSQIIQDQIRIDLSKIALAEALVMGNKNASKKVIIFSDPDCPYCNILHQAMKNVVKKRKDIAFYIKLFPLSIHKDAYRKAKSIVCKKSLPLLEECYAGKSIEKTDCDTKEVDETIKLAESLGIASTPTIILPDGRLRVGAIPENDLINLIDGKI